MSCFTMRTWYGSRTRSVCNRLRCGQIHASTINRDTDNKIRLGTDLRFVNQSRPWDTRWVNDYAFGDGV